MKIITRAAAKAAGKKHYFTGQPCAYGHAEKRLVSNYTCVRCGAIKRQQWAVENADHVRAQRRRYYYEQTPSARRATLLRARNKNRAKKVERAGRSMPNECECCGAPRGSRQLCFDHDHTNGEFRGWICTRCNTGLGKLDDSLEGLTRAVQYLQRYEEKKKS